MSIAPTASADDTASGRGATRADQRVSYLSFAFAYLFGHGGFAVSLGPDPLVELPLWVPLTLLGIGIVSGMVSAMRAGSRAQRGAGKEELLAEKLLGTAWATGFIALFFAITGLTTNIDIPGDTQTALWAAGAVFVVGLINIGEGAVRGNVLHYNLGSFLALVGTAALFLSPPGPFWVISLAGSGAYLVAALLEHRRFFASR